MPAAEVLSTEVLSAEVPAAEVLAAEVLAAEVLAAEVLSTEVLAAEVLASKVVGSEVTAAEMVAAVSSSKEHGGIVMKVGIGRGWSHWASIICMGCKDDDADVQCSLSYSGHLVVERFQL